MRYKKFFVSVEFFSDLVSSKMESLKYLNLNLKQYSHECDCSFYTRDGWDDYVDLYFDDLIKREKSLSHLETLVIGSKFILLYVLLTYFIRYL